MSYEHTRAALPHQIPSSAKLVLLVLTAHACEFCGVTWVGIQRLVEETCLSRTAVQKGLEALRKLGLIDPLAYEHGGRGRTTEYLVMPGVAKLHTSQCVKCDGNRKKGTARGRYVNDGTNKGHGTRAVSDKPHTLDGVKGVADGLQQSVQQEQPRARAREAVASPPVSSTPSLNDAEYAEGQRRLAEIISSVERHTTTPNAKPRDPQNT